MTDTQVPQPTTKRRTPKSATPPHPATSSPADTTAEQAEQADQSAAPLDSLLVDAARGPLRRFIPDASTLKWVSGMVSNPLVTARRLSELAAETGRIVTGTSTVAPGRRDRRFTDEAWTENPVLRRLVQAYLAAGGTAEQLIDDVDLDWRDEKRVRFLVENVVEALAPSNLPLVNPSSAKAAIDSGGKSLARGGRQLLKDMSVAPRIPEMVDTSGFQVGENIGVTPGQVVFRSDVLELIQYQPQTAKVGEIPVLIVPPTINKFYAIDLTPGRSLVEHGVREGAQMFVISWRNPDARHADWGFDKYVESIIEALDAVEWITGSDQTVLGGICSGGILSSIVAAYLAGTGGIDRIKALCFAVTVLDAERSGTASAITDKNMTDAAKTVSRRKGYLDGRVLAEVFAWLRPGDLIWNYWVNNYLLGKRPPAFDILFWNSDTTRMSAALHADFIDMSAENLLTKPGTLEVLGVPIDLSSVTVDTYVVAGIADHITPWENCYGTTQLFGGETRFVLSTSGHIAALVNPPGNPKATFRTNTHNPPSAAAWLESAEEQKGTWWTDITEWLGERCGPSKDAPDHLGGPGFPPLDAAPGTYVFEK